MKFLGENNKEQRGREMKGERKMTHFSIRILMRCKCPQVAAAWSGVHCSESLALTFAWNSTRICIISSPLSMQHYFHHQWVRAKQEERERERFKSNSQNSNKRSNEIVEERCWKWVQKRDKKEREKNIKTFPLKFDKIIKKRMFSK